MDDDKKIYDALENHYKEKFELTAPYSNTSQQTLLFFTVISLAVLVFSIVLHRYFESKYTSYIGLISLLAFMFLYISYAVLFLWSVFKNMSVPTSAYMSPMRKRIKREYVIIGELKKYKTKNLRRVLRRLQHEKKSQNTWQSFHLGAAAKLGLLPAGFAIYAMYSELFARELPYNLDILVMSVVVGFSLGSAMSNMVLMKVDSMIFVIEEVISTKSDSEAY